MFGLYLSGVIRVIIATVFEATTPAPRSSICPNMSLLLESFAVAFRRLLSENRPLSLAIQSIYFVSESDFSLSLALSCEPQDKPVLLQGLRNITAIAITLGCFERILILDGNKPKSYAIQDLMTLEGGQAIAPLEGVRDRALREQQQQTVIE